MLVSDTHSKFHQSNDILPQSKLLEGPVYLVDCIIPRHVAHRRDDEWKQNAVENAVDVGCFSGRAKGPTEGESRPTK
jgi:hypothetical protein